MEYADGSKSWWVNGKYIFSPYSNVLTAALTRGLPIPPKVFPNILKAMAKADGSHNYELNLLNSILHQYWPSEVKGILAKLLSSSDPDIKHLAFSLLGCAAAKAWKMR